MKRWRGIRKVIPALIFMALLCGLCSCGKTGSEEEETVKARIGQEREGNRTAVEAQAGEEEKSEPGTEAGTGEKEGKTEAVGEGKAEGENNEEGKAEAAGEGKAEGGSRKEGKTEVVGEGKAEGENREEGKTEIAGEGKAEEESGEEGIAEAAEEGSAAPQYARIYLPVVEGWDDDMGSVWFSLLYLDDDGIPELVVGDDYFGCYSIYTVKGDTAFCLVDALTTVSLGYYEKTGVVAAFSRWDGGGDEGGYGKSYFLTGKDGTVTEDSMPALRYSYHGISDAEGNYTGEGITEYYDGEEETDKQSFQNRMSELGIVEGNEKVCQESLWRKAEMLDYLRQP